MRLHTLGGLALQGDSGASFTRPKPLLLLAYLALEGARDRAHLSELFFGQAQDPPGSLRTTLRRLRHEAPGALQADGERLQVQLDCDATSVLARLDAGQVEPALEGYTGPFAAGLHRPELNVELEEWVYATREYLAGRVRGALLSLAERMAGGGDFAAAAWLPGADPEPEEYRRLGALLAAGESPLQERLRQQASDFGLTLADRPDVARAALRRPDTPAAPRPAALPVRGTSFVGRIEERGEVQRALERPEVRLLTLVGPGGIGKTRLALEVARTLQGDRDVAYVSLEAVSALATLPTTIGAAIGVTLPAERPAFEALLAALETRRVLLVFDNAEHLLEGAPSLSRLLHACPQVTLLVTSREALGIEEEWVLTVGGLNVPSDGTPFETARSVEAVNLFVQRARRARLDFELSPADLPAARQVCRLVGGSPLGIELAAAWVKLMPVSEIAGEIERSLDFLERASRDVPERHSSVRAVFEQTWGRLTDVERAVLARLSAFRGGFTREAAGRVAGATAVTLATLAGKSLIRPAEEGRYEIHVLLTQFARERLASQPDLEAQTLNDHAACFFEFSQRAYDGIRQLHDEKRWLVWVTQDIENIRAALALWLGRGQADTALRCVSLLRNYWSRSGRTREARAWIARGLSSDADIRDGVRENALGVDGEMAQYMHEYGEARRQLEAALVLADAPGAQPALRLLHLGLVDQATGALEQARQWFEQCISRFRAKGQINGVASALTNLGGVLLQSGDLDGALRTLNEALSAKQASGGDIETVLLGMGEVYLRLGQLGAATSHLLRALRGLAERGYNYEIPGALEHLALASMHQGQYIPAGRLLGASQALREQFDVMLTPTEQAALDQQFALLRETIPAAELETAAALGRSMTLEQVVAYAEMVVSTSSGNPLG